MGRAVHKSSPSCLGTDGREVQEAVLSRGSGMVTVDPVRADLMGNALGLTRGDDFVKETEGLVLEKLRRVEPPEPDSHVTHAVELALSRDDSGSKVEDLLDG